MNEFNWASYWRNSLADAESGKGALKLKDTKGFIKVGNDVFDTGVLPDDLVKQLFKNEKQKTQLVPLIYRPSVLKLKKQHGKKLTGIFPEVISALVCPLWLNRQGYLFPAELPTVPRDLLYPQDEMKFTLGTVDSFDEFLEAYPITIFKKSEVPVEVKEKQGDSIKTGWKDYIKHCRKLYDQVCIALKSDNGTADHYFTPDFAWLFKNKKIYGAAIHILRLYDAITSRKSELPLFQSYAQRHTKIFRPCTDMTDSVALRCGHSSHIYALSDAQRDALIHAVSMDEGDILAVNGPPGTGKTTFVLSVVASFWVDAALDETEPPVIMAASTNNQAVTNIIDAFGKGFSEGEGALSGRWLPEISSYGAYFPARSRENEVQGSYQTKYFFEQVERQDYIERAE